MLYDPTRDIPQLLTVERFKMWLDMQSPEKRYEYGCCNNCALAQYMKECMGTDDVYVNPFRISINGKEYDLPIKLDLIAWEGEHTFGAASKRAAEITQTS